MNVHSELEHALRTGPFHVALRAAIEARGLALHRIRHRLAERGVRVGVTSLSYWQQGERRPARPESLRAVRALEYVLDVPEDSLTRLLHDASDADAERPPTRRYRSLMAAAGALEQLLAELHSPADGGLHTLAHFERVRIGPARELRERESQQVVQAHRGGVDRYIAIHHGDPGCDTSRVRLRATENCRTGTVRHHPATGLVAGELLFDARLAAGDTHVFGYAFEDGTAGASHEYVRGFTFGGGQYLLQVHFDETLPTRCHSFTRTAPAARPTDTRELTLNGRHQTVHLARRAVSPGLVGIGWDWP